MKLLDKAIKKVTKLPGGIPRCMQAPTFIRPLRCANDFNSRTGKSTTPSRSRDARLRGVGISRRNDPANRRSRGRQRGHAVPTVQVEDGADQRGGRVVCPEAIGGSTAAAAGVAAA